MTRDDIIRMALDAHLLNYVDHETPRRYFIRADADVEEVERFAALVAAQKEAQMIRDGWRQCAEGQRTTQFCGLVEEAVKSEREKYEAIIADMAKLLELQQKSEGVVIDMIAAAVKAEREACALVAESYEPTCDTFPSGVANAIRARGKT